MSGLYPGVTDEALGSWGPGIREPIVAHFCNRAGPQPNRLTRLPPFRTPPRLQHSPPMRFRLITYNIHKGIGGVDRRYRPERIIETLLRYEPDVVLLQEVDDGVPRSRRDRQVDLLGDALGLRHREFQPNVKLPTGVYGNAILSRFPLAEVEHVDLSVPLKKRRRALLAHCRVPVNGHTRRLLISNVHLGLAGFERKIQLRRLLKSGIVAHAQHHTPAIAGGDFNDVYGNLGRRLLKPAGFEPAGRYVRTFPAALPLRALDRIYFRGDLRLVRCFASQAGVAKQASDHLPIIAEFEVLARAGSCIPLVCQHPTCRRPPVDPLEPLPAAG
jgi:endonuclease/exonuclease/phosphatase family metal-dependent hydrolase